MEEDLGVSPEEGSDDLVQQQKLLFDAARLCPEEREEILAELARFKKYGLMVCGLTGVGKSTLLNGIIGEDIFAVGDELQHETVEVCRHVIKKDNCSLIVCDTPGLYDDSGNEEQYLKNIEENCGDIETLLYCISVRGNKASLKNDLATLKKLKLKLNPKVWSRFIIVLTFANFALKKVVVKKSINYEGDYRKMIDDWKKAIKTQVLQQLDFISEIESIPMIEAGHESTPSILSDEDYWFSILWHTIAELATDDGQFVLTKINLERFGPRDNEHFKALQQDELSRQPILPNKNWKDRLVSKFPRIAAAVGAGGAAGVTGATVGSVIGALAIGIPSFGIAAGLGLVLGGLIGGGSGVGIGVLTAKAIEVVKRRKDIEKNVEKNTE